MDIVFWIAFGLLLYAWIGYPILLAVLERLLYRPVRAGRCEPAVSLLVVAHNEERVIARKIENLLGLDYPPDKLEIVVASDGSTDRTVELARRYGERVRVVVFPTRRGKASVLNEVVPTLRGGVVVLMDARQRLGADILRKLLPPFADPAVGAASGELVFEDPGRATASRGVDSYWRYEKWIRGRESGIHSSVGATGALLAIRRELFEPLPPETILDDVVLPFRIVRKGYRVVFVPGAFAWDTPYRNWQKEYVRKSRTLSGNIQVLFHLRTMGPPLLGLYGFQYLSHKVLRLLGPVCLALMMIACNELVTRPGTPPLYEWLLFGQVAFYALAAMGPLAQHLPVRIPGLQIPFSFLLMQAAIITGVLRYGSGRDDAIWERAHALDPASTQQRLWRLIFDSALFSCGFILAIWIRYLGDPPAAVLRSYTELTPTVELLGMSLAVPLVIVIPLMVFYFFRVNEPRVEEITPEYFLTLAKGVFYSTLVLFGVVYMRRASLLFLAGPAEDARVRVVSLPTGVLLMGFLVSCALIGGWRLILMGIRRAPENGDDDWQSLMVVAGRRVPADRISRAFTPPARLLALRERPEGEAPALREANAAARVAQALSEYCPTGLLIDAGSLSPARILEAVTLADENELPIRLLPGDLEVLLGGTPLRLTRYIPVLDLDSRSVSECGQATKRLVDIGVGVLWVATAWPALLALLLAARLGGHPLRTVRVRRVGPHGRTLRCRRLRHVTGWPRFWVRWARAGLLGLDLLSGRLALVGARPPLSRRRWNALDPLGRRFLRHRPGLCTLRRLARSRPGLLDSTTVAIGYYARNQSLAFDLQLVLEWWRRGPTRLRSLRGSALRRPAVRPASPRATAESPLDVRDPHHERGGPRRAPDTGDPAPAPARARAG